MVGKVAERVAVLASGGLDSCVLLAELAKSAQVLPIYVRKGLVWEAEERKALESFTKALNNPNVQAITVLTLSGKELYEDHWSVTGRGIPDDKSPSDAVAIPGRNVLLIGLAAVWCSTHEVPRIAIGSLSGNPFPDATPQFFERYESLLSEALGHKTTIDAPFRGILKEDLIRTHANLPLHLSLTCKAPKNGQHCGGCNKCEDRRVAFEAAGVPDKTRYVKR
jgi:7-cyano-7-deazaguanine synthase